MDGPSDESQEHPQLHLGEHLTSETDVHFEFGFSE